MVAPHRITSNPFYQPQAQWQIRVPVPYAQADAFEDAFADMALALSSYELDEATAAWCVEVLTELEPEPAEITSRLALAAQMLGVESPAFEIRPVEAKDWVSEVEKSFPPFCIGRFYVHGSHAPGPAPHGQIALEVNAGAAFGSGEHATTSACLLALSQLARKQRFRRVLDMGCGSGILAIGAAKLWKTPVIGIDIDPVSARVARENARINRTHAFTRFAADDGYQSLLMQRHAPYDLIIANILARPLMSMAPDLARNLAAGGTVILSGLLASQEAMVLSAHRAQGLALVRRIHRNGWSALILQK
jgi:ribosomal protein L11 methyltransferase